MDLGALVVRLVLERGKFKGEMADAANETEKGADKIGRAVGRVTESLGNMGEGAGDAAGKVGMAVRVLGVPLAAAALAAGAVGLAMAQAKEETRAYEKAIILTGNAAGVTTGQLDGMAARIDMVKGTQFEAAAVLAQMTTTARVARENLELVSLASITMERASVQSIAESVRIFNDLGKDPVKASLHLNESLNYLTATMYDQIKAADDLGEKDRAAAIAQEAYATAAMGRAERIDEKLGLLQAAWRKVRDIAKEAWDAMMDIGRERSPERQLSDQEKTVANLEKQLARGGWGTGGIEKQLEAARQRLSLLREETRMNADAAAEEGRRAQQNRSYIDWSERGGAFDSRKDKMAKEIAREQVQGQALVNAGLITEAQLRERIDAIKKKFTDKGEASAAERLAKANVALDLQKIQGERESLVAIYSASEKILEAQRQAGLLGDAEYYQAKRGFIALEGDAKESALEAQLERLRREHFAGVAAVENEKKIAETQAKLDTERMTRGAQLAVLDTQEAAALMAKRAALLAARQAAEDYYATMERQQARELETTWQGTNARNLSAGVSQIEDRYAQQRRELANRRSQAELKANGQLSPEARDQYDAELALLNEYETKSLESYRAHFGAMRAAEGNWLNGAGRAMQDYLDATANVAGQVESLFTKAFQSIEDALVNFAMTGKLSFSSMAQSIISDLIRIQVRAAMTSAIGGNGGVLSMLFNAGMSMLGGWSPAGAQPSGAVTTPVTGGGSVVGTALPRMAKGGLAQAGQAYEVVEEAPELLRVGGRTLLVMGSESGIVTPLASAGSAAAPAGKAAGMPSSGGIAVVVENKGQPVSAKATASRGPDGQTLIRVMLEAVADDMASGGITARATSGRFNLKTS